MTEEIIIDGVDVAGCCYYESKNDTGKWCDLTCTRDNAPVFRCENMPNCYYKQLKRLEQENKNLKEKYTHVLELAKTNADSNEYCLQELERENRELKEQAQLDGECIDKLIEARDMYANALEEIREIAENAKEGRYATKSEDYTEGMRIIGRYVLDKINEVLGDEI